MVVPVSSSLTSHLKNVAGCVAIVSPLYLCCCIVQTLLPVNTAVIFYANYQRSIEERAQVRAKL